MSLVPPVGEVVIRLKLTPYQQHLLDNDFVSMQVDRYSGGPPYQYLAPEKCPFCGSSQIHTREETKIKAPTITTVRTICYKCREDTGTWTRYIDRKIAPWQYVPTEDTDIFRDMFDIDTKVRNEIRRRFNLTS